MPEDKKNEVAQVPKPDASQAVLKLVQNKDTATLVPTKPVNATDERVAELEQKAKEIIGQLKSGSIKTHQSLLNQLRLTGLQAQNDAMLALGMFQESVKKAVKYVGNQEVPKTLQDAEEMFRQISPSAIKYEGFLGKLAKLPVIGILVSWMLPKIEKQLATIGARIDTVEGSLRSMQTNATKLSDRALDRNVDVEKLQEMIIEQQNKLEENSYLTECFLVELNALQNNFSETDRRIVERLMLSIAQRNASLRRGVYQFDSSYLVLNDAVEGNIQVVTMVADMFTIYFPQLITDIGAKVVIYEQLESADAMNRFKRFADQTHLENIQDMRRAKAELAELNDPEVDLAAVEASHKELLTSLEEGRSNLGEQVTRANSIAERYKELRSELQEAVTAAKLDLPELDQESKESASVEA